jgi:hypothetical protein
MLRVNEKETVAKPKFSGTNAVHFFEICESIMRDTRKEVEFLAHRKHEALDVTCSTWQEGMDRFVGAFQLHVIKCLLVIFFCHTDSDSR